MKLMRFRVASFRWLRLGPWLQRGSFTWPKWRGAFWKRVSRGVELFDAKPRG